MSHFRVFSALTWGTATTVAARAADAVLQPGAVGEGVPFVRRPGRRQTLLGGTNRSDTLNHAKTKKQVFGCLN